MDLRAAQLLDELENLPGDESQDFHYWRERFQSLFGEKLDVGTREALLHVYAALLDTIDRNLLDSGHDPTAFREARKADWNTLCLQEALQRSGTDLFYPDDLNEIVQREVAAGRMPDESFVQFTADAAAVLGTQRVEAGAQEGLFSRLISKISGRGVKS